MSRTGISSDKAPAALGPYSQAIVAGGFVFCSGTVGIDPDSGEVRDGIEAQTEQALVNLAAILDAAGSSMADLVKTTVFYAHVEDFPAINTVYARHMPDPPPARSAPANVALPRGLLISIDAVKNPSGDSLADAMVRCLAHRPVGKIAAGNECVRVVGAPPARVPGAGILLTPRQSSRLPG